MTTHTRRQFLRNISGALAASALLAGSRAQATPLGLPLGLQLYSVRELLAQDYEGTLKQVAALGYKEVEAAGFYNRTPNQVKAALRSAGLAMPSSHYSASDLEKSFDDTVRFGQTLGGIHI